MKYFWHRRLAVATAIVLLPIAIASTAVPASASGTCSSHVPSDFNGDGYGDLASSAPFRTIGGVGGAGSVQIDYGSATGINPAKAQYFDQATPGVPGDLVEDAHFGAALSSGYFNGDCYADLAISGNVIDSTLAGWVIVLYGSATGLSTTGAIEYEGPSANSQFGLAMAAGDFNHDGYADLAAAAPYAFDGTIREAGEVRIMYGGPGGLGAPSVSFTQNTPGVPGTSEKYDHFGLSLAAGDFNGDGIADLAIGTPDESDGSVKTAGAIRFLDGSPAGLVADDPVIITQATPGVPGVNESADHFGFVLAAGDVNGDGRADLVAGNPDESVGSVYTAGDIAYLPGGPSGVTGAGTKRYSLATTGFPTTATKDGAAGSTVAVGDFDGNGFAEVAFSGGVDANNHTSVIVMSGSGTGPLTTGVADLNSQTPGLPANFPGYGPTLLPTHLHGAAKTDLAVGEPTEDSGTVVLAGLAYVLPGVTGTGLTGTGSSEIAQAGPGATVEAGFGYAFG